MTPPGSLQLRRYRSARRNGRSMMSAAIEAGIGIEEARLTDADEAKAALAEGRDMWAHAAEPDSPSAATDGIADILRNERCELCADWKPQPDGLGECWSGDRLDGDMTKGPAGYSRGSSGCEAWQRITHIPAPEPAPQPKEDDMARAKKSDTPISGEVPKPDFALAVKLYRDEIRPAAGRVGENAQEMSTAYKAIKKQAHIQPQAARAAFRLVDMEEAKRDDYLRSFFGLLGELKIFMRTDMVDAAEGKGTVGENVVHFGESPKPKLATIPPAVEGDADLADGADQQHAAE